MSRTSKGTGIDDDNNLTNPGERENFNQNCTVSVYLYFLFDENYKQYYYVLTNGSFFEHLWHWAYSSLKGRCKERSLEPPNRIKSIFILP